MGAVSDARPLRWPTKRRVGGSGGGGKRARGEHARGGCAVPVPACAPDLTSAPPRAPAAGAPVAGADAQRGGYAPYFSPHTPPDSSAPDGHVFYYTPGETYTFPPPGYSIELWDDDLNGTVNGWIPTFKGTTICPTGNNVPDTEQNRGCWENMQFPEYKQRGKYLEDPVHISVGAHIGSPDWDPGTSRWWLPYRSPGGRHGERADFDYTSDPFESVKEQYRCSEYNPTLPGLRYHHERAPYAGQLGTFRLNYPNPDADANCWAQYTNSELASSKLNVSYEHVRLPDGKVLTNRTRLSVTFKEDAKLLNSDIPNPQRIICLTSRGVVGAPNVVAGKLETERCWSIVFRVKPKLSVCYQTDTPSSLCMGGASNDPPPHPPPCTPGFINGPDLDTLDRCGKFSLFKTDFATGNGDGSVIPVAVGQKFKAHVYFDDGNRDLTSNCTTCDTIKITVLSDPGLPNGAMLGETKGPHDINMESDAPSRRVPLKIDGQQGAVQAYVYHYSREFTFTPDVRSGMRVSSADNRNGLKYKVCFIASSTTQTFYPPGHIEQKSDTVCAYIQVVRPEPVLPEVVQLQPYVNEPLPMIADDASLHADLPFMARVRCPYKWKIAVYDNKDDETLNPDFQYQNHDDFTAGYDKHVYQLMAKPDPQNPLPKGAKLMHEPGAAYQILSWSPERGMEGKDFTFCLLLADRHISEGTKRMCTTIHVKKCEVCGLPSDTLNSIALEYKTDWLQLWGANHNVTNPNNLQNYLKLQLGPLHTLNKDEKVETLASRFSMTRAGLEEINPDLKGKNLIEKDTQVCLIPRICGDV